MTAAPGRVFHGWWMVAGCLLVAVVGWSLGVFGMGVYIHALSEKRGFAIGLVSTAVTLSYLVTAVCLAGVGAAIVRFGPKRVIGAGAVVTALAVAGLAFCVEAWQLFAVFALLGAGRSCLSPTSISTTLSPWFERLQGRAVSIALLGASVGGIIATPLLLLGIDAFGIQTTFALAGVVSVAVLAPVVLFVFKTRPQDIGLLPDGAPHATGEARPPERVWSRRHAAATPQFLSVLAAFSIGMMVQIGFLSHHVSIISPVLGDTAASLAVSLAAAAAFGGRIVLARVADQVDLRLIAGGVLLVAGVSLGAMSFTSSYVGLLSTSIFYGLTTGALTTLSPIIVRREFGGASFGAVYGVAASIIAIATAFGPGLFGTLRDALGSYAPSLIMAAGLNFVAAVAIVIGGLKPLPDPIEA
ncbi:MAG: MFS transporter [Pseudooceanicola nanhaiensis]|uniref:Major Facilitator Superfamily protein n=1 Tax=Albimonas pacifica TaxID=1114924 RepID=A0A1I3Q3D2_9RHOB|nr:MFS transporter [Albimonas pacifica]SFJ28219.1 Major Facilitator Superfamily protein [Albimonas pacifica]